MESDKEKAEVFYQKALSRYKYKYFDEALDLANKALQFVPEYEVVLALKKDIEEKIREEKKHEPRNSKMTRRYESYIRSAINIKTLKKRYKYICEKCGRFSRVKRFLCGVCGAGFRKPTKDDYKNLVERVRAEQKKDFETRAKMKKIVNKQRSILEAIVKNEEEYKVLLKRQKSRENVEDLIAINRKAHEELTQKDKEHSEIAREWGRSEEAKKLFTKMSMMANMNPAHAKLIRIRSKLQSNMSMLNAEIEKNEEEYEALIARKNNGEYVDDLIKQNRFNAEKMEQSKKKYEDALNASRFEKDTGWRSKLER